MVKKFSLYILLGLSIISTNTYANDTYLKDNTRLVNGTLYDINGDPITGIYEEYYDNNIKKSRQTYKNGVLHGVSTYYTPNGTKDSEIPYI